MEDKKNKIYISTLIILVVRAKIAKISRAIGHTIVARIKNTGSSVIPTQKPSPNSFIKRANTGLCK